MSIQETSYRDGETLLKGVLAGTGPGAKRPGFLVVPEWWGITKHIRDVVADLAARGYAALGVDMYGEGRTAADPEAAGELSKSVFADPAAMRSRFLAGRAFLAAQPGVDASRVGALGYCFGGSVCLEMARQGVDLAGVASFHGGLGTKLPAAPGRVKAKILVLHGAADPFVPPEQVTAFRKEMDAAKADYRVIEYPGAVHAFTNPEADENGRKFGLPLRYDAEVDRKSRDEMLRFFAGLFGTA
jgi:dienelactone hydrolase